MLQIPPHQLTILNSHSVRMVGAIVPPRWIHAVPTLPSLCNYCY